MTQPSNIFFRRTALAAAFAAFVFAGLSALVADSVRADPVFEWDASENATGYRLYYEPTPTAGAPSEADVGAPTTFDAAGLMYGGTEYEIWVRAYAPGYLDSLDSNHITVTPDQTTLAAPGNLHIVGALPARVDLPTFTPVGNPESAGGVGHPFEQVAVLDGDDALRAQDTNPLAGLVSYSVTGWFKPTVEGGEVVTVNRTWAEGDTALLLELHTDGNVLVRIAAGGTTNTFLTNTGGLYEVGGWNWFVVTYHRPTALIEVQTWSATDLLGQFSATHTAGADAGPPTGTDYDTFVGARNLGSRGTVGGFFTGEIADLRIYADRLTVDQRHEVRMNVE